MNHEVADSNSQKRNMRNKLKIGVLVSHPIQYFAPVYREVANINEIDLTVLYRTRVGLDGYHDKGFGQSVKWDIPLLGGYRHKFLSEKKKIGGIEWGVLGIIFRQRFDVLMVHGYNSGTNLLAIAIAKIMGTKVLMRGDTRMQAHHQESCAKSVFKRMLFRMIDGFVTIGSLNRDYYAHHGVTEGKIFYAPFCVDNDHFRCSPDEQTQARRDIRDTMNMPHDARIVLFTSKLIKIKRADDLIKAFSRLTDELISTYLVIAGSGVEQSALQRLAESLGIINIRFIGFQNQSQLPSLFAAADVFVLPSENEPWGLVINEVMNAGVPVVVSNEVGAAPDLVQGTGAGLVYPCGDVDALTQALRSLLASPALRQEMAKKGQELIKKWGLHECAKGISKAAAAVSGKNVNLV